MEATGEDLTLLLKIPPPSLANAGLEDCALPPDAIKEAFLKAASAVSSRASSLFSGDEDEVDGGCISDPWIEKTSPEDALVGIESDGIPPGPCAATKGGTSVGNRDTVRDVVVVGEGSEEAKDEVVVIGGGQGGKGGGCLDGLEAIDKKDGSDADDEEDGKKKPTLVEGFFLKP